ncbi:MAG: hypothetical protein K2K70_11010 [Lachnospiraceae bacterium]|nr:hypothetical protein [Lachnospiraceae bacterium]
MQDHTQEFSEDELALHPKNNDEEIGFVGATDQELIFRSVFYLEDLEKDNSTWYRIPLFYENGQEKVLCDRKEVFYEAGDKMAGINFDAGNYLFCEDEQDCFVLERNTGQKQEIINNDKTGLYGYCAQTDPWLSPDGNVCVVLDRYWDGLPNAIYSYHTGKQKVQEITEGITWESRMVSGDGQVFYTGLVDEKKQNDYNLYVYDMELGVKKVLASEEEIRAMLPEKPAKNADFIRELVYAGGTLYLEIRYGDQCCVLSCKPEQGTLTFLEGIRELVRHKEYSLSEPIKNGSNKYSLANDHNIFEKAGGDVVERTLNGAYVRTLYSFCGVHDLLYVNNQELICQISNYDAEDYGKSVLYSIPLTEMDGNDYPEISCMVEITSRVSSEFADQVQTEKIYADEDYLVCMTESNEFTVYDRKKEKFIDIARLSKKPSSLPSSEIMENNICGEYVLFKTRIENKWELLLYHFGDNKTISIDPLCETMAPAVWSQDGKTIIYECMSKTAENEREICTYDIQTGKKTVLFRDREIYQILEQYGKKYPEIDGYFRDEYLNIYVDSDQLYLFTEPIFGNSGEVCVFRYDLGEKKGLEYVEQSNDCLKYQEDQGISLLGVTGGKLFLKKYQVLVDEEEDDVIEKDIKYYYYDLRSGKSTEFGQNDGEYLYLSLLLS